MSEIDLNKISGWVTWPEGLPEKAKFTTNPVLHWLRFNMFPIIRFRRQCSYWPVLPQEDPVEVAEKWEHVRFLTYKHFYMNKKDDG